MSTRITAFAVDCGGFRDWLGRSVGDALFHIAGNARLDLDLPIFGAYDPLHRYRYLVTSGRSVVRTGGSSRLVITRNSHGKSRC